MIDRAARVAGIPMELLLGVLYAESDNLDPYSQRFYTQTRWVNDRLGEYDRGDIDWDQARANIQHVINIAAAENHPCDFSFGLGHFAICWNPHLPDRREVTPENILALREFVWNNTEADLIQSARKLAGDLAFVSDKDLGAFGGDGLLAAAAHYNSGTNWESILPSKKHRYADKLALARSVIGQQTRVTAMPTQEFAQGWVAGKFHSTPQGVILHGSRSGQAHYNTGREYDGTVGWAQNVNNDYGWNATIGDGRYCLHMGFDQWGHNARAASSKFLAAEFAQPTVGHPISDDQVFAFVGFFQQARERWPNLPAHFPTHYDVERAGLTGARDGKDDVFFDHRADELRSRIHALLGE